MTSPFPFGARHRTGDDLFSPPASESSSPTRAIAVLSAHGITKAFPGVQALNDVDIDLMAGEVHGLVGQNGAGKSTLVKILSGTVEPDSGTVTAFGKRMTRFDPRTARRAGVAVIHQEPQVVPSLSPVANVFLGQPVARVGFLDEPAMRQRFLMWTEELGTAVPTKGATGTLSVALQQAIEVVRALEQGARVVMMDEPTASLGAKERSGLFRMVEALIRQGTSVVYISHKLEDVLRVAGTITVLRHGRRVLSTPAAGTSLECLVNAMLDEDLQEPPDRRPHRAPTSTGRVALRVRSLEVPGSLSGVDFQVEGGEIVGVAGLVGAGRSTLLRAIGGAEPAARGSMELVGSPVPWPRSPRRAHRYGVVLAPEDRRTEGLVMSLTAWENLVLPSLSALSRWGFSTHGQLLAAAEQEAVKVGYSADRLKARVGNLSGGNQQKLVLGKLLLLFPKVLLVDEPTRGIDVAAKAEIFNLLRSLAAQGTAVVIVSEEIQELVSVADRVIVLCEGRVSDEIPGPIVNAERILEAMLPSSREASA